MALRGSRRSVTAAAAVGWCAFGRKPAGFSVGVERHGPPPERPVALLLSSCTSGAYVLDAVHSRGVSARQRAGSCWWANEACAAACEEGRAVVAGPWARGPMLSDQRQAVTTTLSRARRPCLRTAASKPAQRESTSTYKGVADADVRAARSDDSDVPAGPGYAQLHIRRMGLCRAVHHSPPQHRTDGHWCAAEGQTSTSTRLRLTRH